MIDPKLIRNEPDTVRTALRRRGMDTAVVDRLILLDVSRRELLQRADDLKAERNAVSKELGQKKKAGGDITEESARMRAVGEEIDRIDAERIAVEKEQQELLDNLPSIPHPDVPDGKSDEENVLVRSWGDPAAAAGRPHWEIGEHLEIIDFKRSAQISGSRFWLLKGAGARLERALISFFLDVHTRQHGYTEILPPALVNGKSLYNTGQLPRFGEDLFKCEGTDLYLVPTAEVPITNMHANEILTGEQLPLYYCGFSPSFRSEAGAAGRDTRGLVRVHQFHKVELVKFTTPDTSFAELDKMVADAEKILQLLEIPYRVMRICIGDLGYTAAMKYDLEFWSPAQERWIEISSCSNCTDYQARRGNIRFRREQKASPEFVHTLNGSGLAVGRTMVAIAENFQNEDKTIDIPKVLRPYMGGEEKIAIG